MGFKDTDIYYLREELKVRYEENFEIAIYDRNTGKIHELNPTAAYIFIQITESKNISEIIKNYNNHYNLQFEESKSDVLTTIKEFLKLNIISDTPLTNSR